MQNRFTGSFGLLACLLLASVPALAHHGTAVSYDTVNVWSTWATVTEFNYLNPHPSMTFDRTDKNGHVEHWVAEASSNPSQLARAGWTKSRCLEALKPGTRVKLYLGTSRVGGFSAVVLKIENEKGEGIASEGGSMKALDLDGVPGGYQPRPGDDKSGEQK